MIFQFLGYGLRILNNGFFAHPGPPSPPPSPVGEGGGEGVVVGMRGIPRFRILVSSTGGVGIEKWGLLPVDE